MTARIQPIVQSSPFDPVIPVSTPPELIIGLVGAIGANVERVAGELSKSLSDVGYQTKEIHVIELLKAFDRWKSLPDKPAHKRYHALMSAGTEFRGILDRGDALALLSLGGVKNERERITGEPEKQASRQAYILRSLKTHEEAETLRTVYGSAFVLVSAYSPKGSRIEKLKKAIASSLTVHMQASQVERLAEELIVRDRVEADVRFGQNVQGVFHMADVFINAGNEEKLRGSVRRFIESFFAHPYHTPDRDEYGMFHAHAAALRSSALGRQVGASIASAEHGEIIALGTNEVPKSGGGTYWHGEEPDHRDFNWGYDSSDQMRRSLFSDIIDRLKKGGWLAKKLRAKETESLAAEALTGVAGPIMKGAKFLDLIEFGRAVHAEMAALLDAARRGVSVSGATLYTTTFPCHDCAKHIVASGIARVVYIEPYPKSRAEELHADSILIDERTVAGPVDPAFSKVTFESFVGIAPRRYLDLFTMPERKL